MFQLQLPFPCYLLGLQTSLLLRYRKHGTLLSMFVGGMSKEKDLEITYQAVGFAFQNYLMELLAYMG
jgi:hypothetical protein